jgi:hypothetical protein
MKYSLLLIQNSDRHCKSCKSTTHNDVDCWVQRPEKQPAKKGKGGRNSIKSIENLAMSAYVTTQQNDDATRIIDSGATNHLLPHRELFEDYMSLLCLTRI